MDTWSTVLGQRTMENICSMAHDVGKISDNQPTLRDMFAMQAMTALIQTPWGMEVEEDKIASTSYSFADQMLKAREVKK